MKLLHYTISTWFGLGMSPKAPGTLGSLGTLPLVALFAWAGLATPLIEIGVFQVNAFFPLAWFIFFCSVPSVNWVIRDSGAKDPQFVVIDEVAGQLLAFSFISSSLLWSRPILFVLGFGLFRFFDILKPLGIRKLEGLPGAWGVLSDDMLGGLYAGIALYFVSAFFF